MNSHSSTARWRVVFALLVALCLAVGVGAWQGRQPAAAVADAQTSAFVQSGGVTNDVLPSVPDAAHALSRGPSRFEASQEAPTF
ncbi:MAG: hypothetical protein ABW220_12840 [Burkholderiaceae bacterium]